MAESPKIIDNQMASVFFRQELPEYRALYSEPPPQHLQKKPIDHPFQPTEPWTGIFVISISIIESHGPFQVMFVAQSAWRAGHFQQSPKRGETGKPVKPVNGPDGWC